MTRRLVLAMTLMSAAVALALAVPLTVVVSRSERAAFVAGLEVETLTTALLMSSQSPELWPQSATDAAQRTGARVVVVDQAGQLVADSEGSGIDRSFNRPEISAALAGSLTSDIRQSTTLGVDLRYVAAPIVRDGGVQAAVRLSLPESDLDAAERRTQAGLTTFVVAVILAAALLAWLLARSMAAPLTNLAAVAEALPTDLARRADEDEGPAEVRHVAVTLNSTAERLDELIQRSERVAADASHHLRTPLTGVRLRLEAIEETSGDPAIVAQAVAATTEVDRLSRRIDQVLALARSDSGSGGLEPVDVRDIVTDRVGAFRLLAEQQGLTVTMHLGPKAVVLAFKGTVARCIDELLSNALLYASSTIVVTTGRESGSGWLLIEDDGPGVPQEERDSVFTRFSRGSTAVPGGSGLGLALVREQAHAAGGSAVALESAAGGLGVRVTWPLAGPE